MTHNWLQHHADLAFPSDINSLIFDYLMMEGYPNAAAKFSKEANLQPHQADDTIQLRQQIQHSIHIGSVQSAIEALNDLDPEVRRSPPFLCLAMIRTRVLHAPLI